MAICLVGASGCSGQDTIWTTETPSPDGRWLATADTVETSGFGTGDIETDVYLKWTKASKSPEHILGLVHNPNSTSKTNHLSLKWLDATHLEVTYDGDGTVDFQVVKLGDVYISLQVQPCHRGPESREISGC